MRLWHQDLISKLPRQQLLGQHRECCALRGKGWGRPHATVNYVFDHSPYLLYLYHEQIMEEMERRGYKPAADWHNPLYRGASCSAYDHLEFLSLQHPLYPEHNQDYLEECLANLAEKGIII